MSDPDPHIDLTLIKFPTDSLTIEELRKRLPHAFDLPAPDDYVHPPVRVTEGYLERIDLETELGGTLSTEREIAEHAFYEAMGREKPEYLEGRDHEEAVDCLTEGYIRLGLAKGEHYAQELVRSIERQAVEQARRFKGPTPPRP